MQHFPHWQVKWIEARTIQWLDFDINPVHKTASEQVSNYIVRHVNAARAAILSLRVWHRTSKEYFNVWATIKLIKLIYTIALCEKCYNLVYTVADCCMSFTTEVVAISLVVLLSLLFNCLCAVCTKCFCFNLVAN